MTARELTNQLRIINQERMLASLHDENFLQDLPDVDALNTAIILINFLAIKKPSDKLTVEEIFREADIDF